MTFNNSHLGMIMIFITIKIFPKSGSRGDKVEDMSAAPYPSPRHLVPPIKSLWSNFLQHQYVKKRKAVRWLTTRNVHQRTGWRCSWQHW